MWSWWDVIGHEWMPIHRQARENPEFPGRCDVRHPRLNWNTFREAYPVGMETGDRRQPGETIFDTFETRAQVVESLVDRFPNTETFELAVTGYSAEYLAPASRCPCHLVGATLKFPSRPGKFEGRAWHIFNFLGQAGF